MDWTKFNNHGESNNHAFEVMCNLLFEAWCKQTYREKIVQFSFVNGDGGDGGVEAYCVLEDGNVVGVQSKWFPMKIEDSQIRQIESSIQTAKKVRPQISTYVVCVPRDLGSKKIVKGGGLAQNTEADRWITLVEKCKLSYPDLEIILWDETRLQEKLLQPETQGAYRYWFENTVVFDQQFELSYSKAVNSWAKHKYIPEIHTRGYIHERLGYFLGCDELAKKRYDEVGRFVNRLEALSRAYKDILALGFSSSAKELEDKIAKDIESIRKWLALLVAEKEAIKDGGSTKFTIQPLGLSCSAGDIKEYSWNSGRYFHYRDADKLIEDIDDDFFNLCCLLEQSDSNKLIFTGVQGTGKTAGIVAEASLMLQSNSHLPVIIHAKDYSEGETWASIITKTLGINTEWNEIDLLCALQNAAFLRKHMNEDGLFVTPNCVICVDGIDEASSWKFWRDRIEETVAFSAMFPRIKFIFLSRPYVFADRYELTYSDCFYSLPMSGDGDLEEICDKYFVAYRIDIGENNWIRENLKTPIAVKLFCDIYGNRKIDNLSQNTVVLTELLKAKVNSLEQAYSIAHHITGNSHLVYTSLVQLAELFAENNTIPVRKIADIVSEPLKSHLQDILDFLANEGFIYSYSCQEDDFSLPEVFSSWGIQPVFDYLIAQKIFRRMTAGEKVDIENVDGIYQMLSLVANVFSQEGLKIYENVAIRYYGAGLVRIAISKGLLNEDLKEVITPPYNYEPEIMPLCKEALDANRMGGYKAIDYDLARYVLCDHLDDYFRNHAGSDEYHACVKQFLERYTAEYEMADVKIEGFIIALAYQYLLDQGWNPEIFWSYEDKQKFGVDIVIRRTHYPATHGAMSRVMTVAEKNVWLAKHRIEAVFANEIPLHEYGCPLQYVTDYSRLENFINTYQDYVNRKNQETLHCWFNADILASPEFKEMNKENIETWMNDTGLPLFEKWFSEHDGRLLLCSFTDVQNNISGVQEAAWISSGAVRAIEFERFLSLMEGYFEDRAEMLNVNDFHTYQDCRCYCTPQEACLVHCDREINRSLLLPDNEEDIEIFKLTEECLSADELETEKSFTFPSRFVREITGIVYGDGYSYSDNEGRAIANYSTDGENWGTHQNTLTIDADAMHIGLATNKYKMFWLYRLYKEPSPKARERFPDIQHSTDRTYLVWKDGEVFKSKELLPVQPVRENVSVDIPDEIKAILKAYRITDDTENS